MRSFLIPACVAIVVVWATSTSRSDPRDAPTTGDRSGVRTTSTDEPITGQPVTPAPGSETPIRDPFSPYATGGAAAEWKSSALKPSDQATATRDANSQARTNNAYATAITEQAKRAASASAASQLGVENLPGIGVVP
jgi:hypothetical protein